MNLKNLTAEERETLRKQFFEEERKKEEERKAKIEGYKTLVDETVLNAMKKIKGVSTQIGQVKKSIFADFKSITELKGELYGVNDNQQSHTFTTSNGKYSITLGYRMVDAFDDTVHSGIEKVKKYIYKSVQDENSHLLEIVNLLLKKDKNGNLKASRVMELEKIAGNINDDELTEGVQIIKEAWKPQKSKTFIEAYYKDENGNKINIPLSMTTVMEDMEDLKNGEDKERTN
ncbi:DUF3164 family protein [Fusobacterium polymorphum]|uniref:DUF3164 family protein n=1 Tax=Fusobacterium nucleatum subsp. polymorphum TaxID=76857 RepID=UPI00300AB03F